MKIPDGWVTRIVVTTTGTVDYPSEVANVKAIVHLRDHGPLRVFHNALICVCEQSWDCDSYDWSLVWHR